MGGTGEKVKRGNGKEYGCEDVKSERQSIGSGERAV